MYLECGFDGLFQSPCKVDREVSWTTTADGMCHTFNSAEQIQAYGPKISTRAGGKYGLTLTINVEQYDYFQGNSNSTGVQVKD